ncbi:mevalonate kinase [Marinilabilia salmonicolor]|jgi:mevalonate kinase|uniref:Mevalonate kinase n=1 Tax=Marinilabilia salmonicolor TaxID=989 RepID=A0A2T0XMU3_9BACT|nr:mevalonate kinase [Marinilabilia salmonicolor]PRZ00246.1 mevalonate kinase [Marinilabilia salmonicolor]RCW38311.1 mevalonate kinase [Marinilabilia salmonicolor]
MQNEAGEIFYSKIMLFGEYTIIKGSMGLTIPYAHFNGQLAFPNKDSYTDLAFAQRSNQHLYDFWYYLQSLVNNNSMLSNFNTDQLKEDLDNGLYFESTIPEGYGLGSSGALVAAFFQRYVSHNFADRDNMTPSEIRSLKEQLSQLESWFHGTSSGIDPLICYFKHPLLLKDLDHIEPVGLPRYDKERSDAIFLINSGKPGKTAPLVQHFMTSYDKNDAFRDFTDHQLTPLNNACINNLINNDKTEFYQSLKELSSLQKKHLSLMVPPSIHTLWEEGIDSQEYFLKLCGSGGGGFILGFTRDYESTRKFMDKNGLETIPVYQDLRKTIKT